MLAPLEVIAVEETGDREFEGLILDGDKVFAIYISRFYGWKCECGCDCQKYPITPEMVCPHLLAASRLPIYA